MFVIGGTYKSFYINHLSKINNIDLLVFGQNIFYDFDYEQEYLFDAPVTKELIELNKKLNCPIVVRSKSRLFDIVKDCFVICINGKVAVVDCEQDIYVCIKNKLVLISNIMYKRTKAFATIVMGKTKQNWKNLTKSVQSNYFICDKKSVIRLQNGKFYRKFRKCCYFSLCFYKKMI